MDIRFMWNGIKIDGFLYKGYWSPSRRWGVPGDSAIYFHASDYGYYDSQGRHRFFPKVAELTVINNSDIMTDYFDKDTIFIEPDNPYYSQAQQALSRQQAHDDKLQARRQARYAALAA